MEHQEDQKQDRYDGKNPKDNQVFHLDVEEETFRSCSLHLHVLLNASSGIRSKIKITVYTIIQLKASPLAVVI